MRPGHEHVLEDAELGQQVVKLEDEADEVVAHGGALLAVRRRRVVPFEHHTTRGGRVQQADEVEQSGLA